MRTYRQFKNTLLACMLLLTVTACSGDAASNDAEDALTGNRFFDAAADRLVQGVDRLDRRAANCVIQAMIDDGSIGVGEINQAPFEDGRFGGPERIQAAFESALEACR